MCWTDGVDQKTASMHMSITYTRTCMYMCIYIYIYNITGQSAYVHIRRRCREECSNSAVRNTEILLMLC